MDREEIKKIADSLSSKRIFRNITLGNCGYVNLKQILYEYGIKLLYIDFNATEYFKKNNIQGACFLDKDKYKIYIQQDLSCYRKKYAIAVQLGHIFLKHFDKYKNLNGEKLIFHFNKNTYYKIDKSMNNELVEAIYFAKELLMPEEDVLKESKRFISLFISDMMDIFKVSDFAIKDRFQELGINEYYDT